MFGGSSSGEMGLLWLKKQELSKAWDEMEFGLKPFLCLGKRYF
jgi:hypothetical protein